MPEGNGLDHVSCWRRLSKVFITRAIMLCVGVVAVLCLGIALARFDNNLMAVRGQNIYYYQGDVFGEIAVAAVCQHHLSFPLPSQLRSLMLGLSSTGIPLGRHVRILLLSVHRQPSSTSWVLHCRRAAVLSDSHGLPDYGLFTECFYEFQQFR